MHKLPEIASFYYLRNEMLDYLDFWYVHRPLSHGNNLSYVKLLQMITFFLKDEGRERGSSNILLSEIISESCRYRFLISFQRQFLLNK